MKERLWLWSIIFLLAVGLASAQETENTCTDSDGGINEFTYGITHPEGKITWVSEDSCELDGKLKSIGDSLNERYCENGEGKIVRIECEYGCVGGVCRKATGNDETTRITNCEETDGGKDYYSGGAFRFYRESLSGELLKTFGSDTCVDSNTIREFYCENGYRDYELYDCPNGCTTNADYTCNEDEYCGWGAVCIPDEGPVSSTTECVETDAGIDKYTYGGTAIKTDSEEMPYIKWSEDHCNKDYILDETYCENGALKRVQIECEYGCVGGVCRKETGNDETTRITDCEETDGGKDYYSGGAFRFYRESLSGEPLETFSSDTCVDSNTIREFYCENGYRDYELYDCPNGCTTNADYTCNEEGYCGWGAVCIPDEGLVSLTAECIETDAGMDKYTYGGIAIKIDSETTPYIKWSDDDCIKNYEYILRERYCDEHGVLMLEEVCCEYGCIDGVCKKQTGYDETTNLKACEETDNGRDYFSGGVTRSARISTGEELVTVGGDQCVDSITLREHYCEDGYRNIEYYKCPEGCKQMYTGEGDVCNPVDSCFEFWECSEWSKCENNMHTRTCSDTNNCGTVINKPEMSRECCTVDDEKSGVPYDEEIEVPDDEDEPTKEPEDIPCEEINGNIVICHKVSPNEGTIVVSADALQTHLDHGDYCGICKEEDFDDPGRERYLAKLEQEYEYFKELDEIRAMEVEKRMEEFKKQVEREEQIAQQKKEQAELAKQEKQVYIQGQQIAYEIKETHNEITIGEKTIKTHLGLTFEKEEIYIQTNKGKYKIKITPEQAINKTKKLTDITDVEIDEVEGKAIYTIHGKKKIKIFNIFPVTIDTSEQVDIETGEILTKHWWDKIVTE